MRPYALFLAPLLFGACATLEPVCPQGMQAMVSEQVFFGTDKPGGKVSPVEWADFVDRSVTPRFPQGLTVWPAQGQWRGEQGKVVREPSYILTLVHSGDAVADAAVVALAKDYQQRFAQEAVLRVRSRACVSF